MTTAYLEYYWDSADVSHFLPVLATQPNVIGPLRGRAGYQPELIDEAEQVIDPPPAYVNAVGDPLRWYLAVRTTEEMAVPDGCSVTETALAQQILGVWA